MLQSASSLSAAEGPTQINVKYSTRDAEGRLTTEMHHVQELDPDESVRGLELLVYDLLGLSPRQPIELRYHGNVLAKEKLLKEYGIKDPPFAMEHRTIDDPEVVKELVKIGSAKTADGKQCKCPWEKFDRGLAEITVVVKPKLPKGAPLPGGEQPLRKLRLASKLDKPLILDSDALCSASGRPPAEMTVRELKERVEAQIKGKIFIAEDNVEEDERTGGMALKKCDAVKLEQAAVGGKKGINKVIRMRDGAAAATAAAAAAAAAAASCAHPVSRWQASRAWSTRVHRSTNCRCRRRSSRSSSRGCAWMTRTPSGTIN